MLEKKNKSWIIWVIWIFHISALIGISVGFEEWFVSKTPINLLISSFLLFLAFPLDTGKKIGFFILLWSLGMLAEWIGVHYGILFGSYTYGFNLGPKIDGVPVLIGINWALLTFVTASIAQYVTSKGIFQVVFAGFLMLVLDYFMEQTAPRFDFWEFERGVVPLWNYVSWLGLALVFQMGIRWLKISGDLRFSAHLYAVQLIFFLYFYLWF